MIEGALVQFAAGVASLLIAALVFGLRPGSGPNRAFALVLALSGGLLVTASLTLQAGDPRPYARMHGYYVIASPFAIAYFVHAYRGPRLVEPQRAALVLGAGALALLAIQAARATAYWDVATLARGVEPYASQEVPKGPLILFVRIVEISAGLAALAFARDYLRSATPARRRSLLLVSLGFFVPVACTCAIVDFLVRVLGGTLLREGAGMSPTLAAAHDLLLIGQVLLVLGLIALMLRAALTEARPDVRRGAVAFALTLAATATTAAAVVFVVPPGPLQDQAVYGLWGLWNGLGALLIAYGLLRLQIFDIDLKIKWTLRRGTVAAAFVAVFFVVSELAQEFLVGVAGPILGVAAAGMLVFALAPLQQWSDRVVDRAMPNVKDTAEYRLVRKRELYRAAVESAKQDGAITERERDILARLSDELGLTALEARDIERETPGGGREPQRQTAL